MAYVVLNDKVLDVTDYLEAATNIIEVSTGIYSRSFALDRMFLPLDLTKLLFISLGEDITDSLASNVSNANTYASCMETLFYKGIVKEAQPTGCQKINPALWATMGAFLLYFLVKMNLAHLCRLRFMQSLLFSSHPEFSSSICDRSPHTILMIPCFSESSDILKQSLDSLARTHYEDSRKLLLFVCDGVTRASHDSKETHLCVLEALNHSGTIDPVAQPYLSLGQNRKKVNYAKVYSGYYETGRNRVPYMVVVKVGSPREEAAAASAPAVVPGNRGKRDSMVLVFGFLERCMNLANNRMTPLEYELFNQCYSVLGVDPRKFKYMLVTDADTQVQGDVVQTMVSRLEKDRRMLAISGHVRPANPEQNITTMLQIFPLYLTFYSGLAYEAFLGTVLSINGGFMMYKLWTENVPLDEKRPTVVKRWHPFKRASSATTSQQTIQTHKWPKVSDEINPWEEYDRDCGSSLSQDNESRLSLAPNTGIRPCCIHPTVLRGFAAPQADTMHMKNVLLLGEEQYLGIVLLRSHPHHRLGFEPEAIGYATLPTNIFALQALQSRNLRAAFHNQLEMQRVAWDLGIACWFVSLTKLLDMILSMPIIVYLYGVYIRFFMQFGLAYTIIAISFTCLIVLHILYFIVRRQFKYVFWFIIYGLFAVPLFAVWFPLVSFWCSDYAERWYDVWPTANRKRRGRLHGIVDDTDEKNIEHTHPDTASNASDSKELSDEELVPRMRLGEFEVVEAEKQYQRAVQEAAALDSNFTGFTGIVNGRTNSMRSNMSRRSDPFKDQIIPSPPMAQLRGYNSVRASGNGATSSGYKPKASVVDMYSTVRNLPSHHPHHHRSQSQDQPSPTGTVRSNPFASALDNPFDDGHAVLPPQQQPPQHTRRHHKPSHSQSSYFTYSSRTTNEDYSAPPFVDPVLDDAQRTQSYPATADDRASITSNAHSLASSNLSLDPEAFLESRTYGQGTRAAHGNTSLGGRRRVVEDEQADEGRSTARHGKVGLTIPGQPLGGYPPPPSGGAGPSGSPNRR